uniref:Amine oxidase domain-containing protein n=1 Tax=Lotharella oceanica TaxID=641309 RepID=A0A7S2TK82_9EUKA
MVTGCPVRDIVLDAHGRAQGVRLDSGEVVTAKQAVVSNLTPFQTMVQLLPDAASRAQCEGSEMKEKKDLSAYCEHIRGADYTCGSFKINCALDKLPNFACLPNHEAGSPGPQHRGTIHFENHMREIEQASLEASRGIPTTRPVIEMTIPSSLDTTVAPPGQHVAQLFVQFAPYDVDPSLGVGWEDPGFKQEFVSRVFSIVEEFAPGFQDSILGVDALSPLDLEQVFGLHKGNIFHGALSLNQIGWARPAVGWSSHRTPVDSLYLCGAGNHPGGGVSGAPGRNCAAILLSDMGLAMK